jgi:putative transposase
LPRQKEARRPPYLYINNGKRGSQVLCKICHQTTPTNGHRRERKACYWCPHCGYALFRWKEDGICTAYKCPNDRCPLYERNLAALTPEEQRMREGGNTSQFKLRYLFREYHFASENLQVARPSDAPVDLNRIHNNLYTVGLCLTFSVSFGLSARMSAQVLKRVFDISISHQTVINYINASASYLTGFVDENCPDPKGPCAADETYIKVEGYTRYTWLLLEQERRAICGYNLSSTRGTEPALALINNCYGPPESPKCNAGELVTDGLPSYDSAVVAYNTAAIRASGEEVLTKRTVIGLQDLDPESEAYREFKQLVERLNRTYKFHTRPRAGFKNFDGAVALTTLFVAHYNFMRPHGRLNDEVPVELSCLKGKTLYPAMWVEMLRQAA